jgi:hypothetical protein
MTLTIKLASAISLLGDVSVLLLVGGHKRRTLTDRVLACFAAADAISMVLQLLGNPTSSTLCEAQAAALWAATWSSWLWIMAYAFVVERAFVDTNCGAE